MTTRYTFKSGDISRKKGGKTRRGDDKVNILAKIWLPFGSLREDLKPAALRVSNNLATTLYRKFTSP